MLQLQCQIGDNVETDRGKPQLLTLPWQATAVSKHVGLLAMLSTMPWQATALDSAVASYSDFKMRCTVLLDSDTRKQ